MDGVNLTTEVVYKRGQDYRFVCYDQGHACRSYRVRFLCGRPGKQPLVRGTGATVALSFEPAAAWWSLDGGISCRQAAQGVELPPGSGTALAVVGAGRAPQCPLTSQAWLQTARTQWAGPPAALPAETRSLLPLRVLDYVKPRSQDARQEELEMAGCLQRQGPSPEGSH